ncbi:unnamed protein product, partial [Laminaria digitata]
QECKRPGVRCRFKPVTNGHSCDTPSARGQAAGGGAPPAIGFRLSVFTAAVTPPDLGISSAVSIRPSRLQLPHEVSSRSRVKAGGLTSAHAPSGGAEFGNSRFTGAAASKT